MYDKLIIIKLLLLFKPSVGTSDLIQQIPCWKIMWKSVLYIRTLLCLTLYRCITTENFVLQRSLKKLKDSTNLKYIQYWKMSYIQIKHAYCKSFEIQCYKYSSRDSEKGNNSSWFKNAQDLLGDGMRGVREWVAGSGRSGRGEEQEEKHLKYSCPWTVLSVSL